MLSDRDAEFERWCAEAAQILDVDREAFEDRDLRELLVRMYKNGISPREYAASFSAVSSIVRTAQHGSLRARVEIDLPKGADPDDLADQVDSLLENACAIAWGTKPTMAPEENTEDDLDEDRE